MNVAVVGLGGVGGFLGAKLARAYPPGSAHGIHFVARGAHLNAIQLDGLTLTTGGEAVTARPRAAAHDPSGWPEMDLILVCVKGYDLDAAVRLIRPIVGASTVVLPLQNGIGKRERVEEILSRGLVGDGCIYVSAYVASPGSVVHAGGPGRVIFGRDAADVQRLVPQRDFLTGAGIQAELVGDVDVAVWTKYVFLCALAGATALHREALGQILADEGKVRLVQGLMAEVETLARKRGVPLPGDIVGKSLAVCRAFPGETKSSLLHDLEQGRPHELDWLVGSAIAEGERLGVEVPLLRSVYEGIRSRWFGGS